MEIKVPEFIYKRFHKLQNAEYELGWIAGYMDKKVFQESHYKTICFSGKMIECSISPEAADYVAELIKSSDMADVELAVQALYYALYILGGTN